MKNSKLYHTTKDKLIAARKRRIKRKTVGSDEEYSKCIIEEYLESKRYCL